jgi:hypothetical protein
VVLRALAGIVARIRLSTRIGLFARIGLSTRIGALGSATVGAEENTPEPDENEGDEPSEEDNHSGNPESGPPVHRTISIIEGRLGPQQDE